jgi:hypothetical protein
MTDTVSSQDHISSKFTTTLTDTLESSLTQADSYPLQQQQQTPPPVVVESLANSREKRIRKQKAYDDDFVTFGLSGSYSSYYSSLSSQQQSGELNAGSLGSSTGSGFAPNDAKFNVCDLVWAKVSGHPWWPCMVNTPAQPSQPQLPSLSPQTKSSTFRPVQAQQHAKYVGGLTRPKLMIYVEFFGASVEHAWVTHNSIIEYKGVDAFKQYAQQQVDLGVSKSAKEKLADKFQLKVAQSKREQWEQAIREADAARLITAEERREIFVKKNAMNESVMRKSVPKGHQAGDSEDRDGVDEGDEPEFEEEEVDQSVGSDSLDFGEG